MDAPRLSLVPLLAAVVPASPSGSAQQGAPLLLRTFETRRLSDRFTCEGATFGDLDRDGHADVIAGTSWWGGPDFAEEHRFRAGEPFDPAVYSDAFFFFTRDFDGDGWLDVLMVGFPGEAAYWYQNPAGEERLWKRSLVHPTVDNESPAFTDLTGDGAPELVFHTGGVLGWAQPVAGDPFAPWTFHRLSENTGRERFTHGLGVGDVNGDGRADVLLKNEWREQPPALDGDPEWKRHAYPFAPQQGGAQMYVFDVDGDGLSDVVTSLEAHGFGLVWHRQLAAAASDGGPTFEQRAIMGASAADSPFGVKFGEPHAIDFVDVNADGLPDIVSGKRWWSHGAKGDPEPDAPAVVYWFELARGADGAVDWVPHLVHDDSGVGVQVVAGDVDGDGLVDVVTGNKKGVFVHLQRAREASREEYEAARPRRVGALEVPRGVLPLGDDGEPLNLDFETGTLEDWIALEDDVAFEGQPVRGDTVFPRRDDMTSDHAGEFWIGTFEVGGDEPTGSMRSAAFTISHPWASFLVAGGGREETRVDLVLEDGERFASATGYDHERLRRVVVDLSQQVGQRMFVRLIDRDSGGWGHLNFDDFRFHDTEPVFPDPLEEILALDVVEHDGLAPSEACEAMDVPQGFHVELVAAEPDVHQPIAFTIDERGRLWVVEAYAYPLKRPEGEGRDRILIFEDANVDGVFETRKVFASDLNLVSGIEVGFGGVWIGAAPELLFIPDRDGDDVPDGPPEVLLDGWGHEDTHETLNAFTWGPDGWLYGCHGVFTHSRVGKPGTPDAEREPINAGVWRYHPTRHEFEVFAWGSSNPWGVDFDDDGQAFITACVIPHLYHAIQGARYQRQAGEHFNPHVYADIQTIADHVHYLGSWSHAGNNRSNAAGGGHAHCGLMVYLGHGFPEEYRGKLFFNNVHGNRVNVDAVERSGSGFVGRHGEDFLVANDRRFRGINLRSGPDGSVYLIDWYDAQACHTSDDAIWNRGNGRVYRVAHGACTGYPGLDLAALSSRDLAGLQLDANEWFVRTARRILQERGPDLEVRAYLLEVLEQHPDPRRKLRALWALHASGNLAETDLLLSTLDSEHEYLRAWSVQLLCEGRDPSSAALAAFAQMAREDPSPVVRLYLASALQRLGLEDRWPIAAALLEHEEDADDHNLPLVIWYGVEPLVPADAPRALALAETARIPLVREFCHRRAASDYGLHDALVEALMALEPERPERPERQRAVLDQFLAALEERREVPMPAAWGPAYEELAASADPGVRERAQSLAAVFGDARVFPELRATLADPSQPAEARQRALTCLLRGADEETAVVLQGLVANGDVLRAAAIRGLAGIDQADTPQVLLARYADLPSDERADVVTTLAARASYARALLAAVGEGAVPRADLAATTLRQLRAFEDEELDATLAEVWGVLRDTSADKSEQMAEWKAKLTEQRLAGADLALGREVYARTCMRCHTLYGTGEDVGPDITGSNRSDLDYLLENVLDPNALVPNEYRVTLVRTGDGRLVTGILAGESEDAITLRTENETLTIALSEIEQRKLDSISMMPEDQLATLDEEEAVALIAYLRHDGQVPRLVTEENRAGFFDGTSLAGWSGDEELWSVEGGEIVGRTATGLGHNAFLVSDFLLRDFRLVVEVRLTPDEANSGIQFRSRPVEGGEVHGYQADVGEGWWGKLYEELGRGTLCADPGAGFVRVNEWNTYEILAVGDLIRTAVNGHPCADLTDPDGAREGQIALQIHSGLALEVRFRRLEIELDPDPELRTVAE